MLDTFPDLDLYNEVYKLCNSLGLNVYDNLESKNKEYPFIQLQDVQFIPKATKTHYLGTAHITINLYDYLNKKKSQSAKANNVLMQLMRLKNSKHYNWSCSINTASVRYKIDTTTSDVLSHAIVNVEMNLR